MSLELGVPILHAMHREQAHLRVADSALLCGQMMAWPRMVLCASVNVLELRGDINDIVVAIATVGESVVGQAGLHWCTDRCGLSIEALGELGQGFERQCFCMFCELLHPQKGANPRMWMNLGRQSSCGLAVLPILRDPDLRRPNGAGIEFLLACGCLVAASLAICCGVWKLVSMLSIFCSVLLMLSCTFCKHVAWAKPGRSIELSTLLGVRAANVSSPRM